MTSQFRRWERNHRDDASWFPVANVSVPVILKGFLQPSPFLSACLYHVCRIPQHRGSQVTLTCCSTVISPLKLRQASGDGGSGVVFDCNPTHLPFSLPLTQTTQCSFVSREKE